MEAIGIIAAVPELVKLVKSTYTTLGRVSSKARTAELSKGIQIQLDLLSEILTSIQFRHETAALCSAQAAHLGPVIRDLHTEIKQLERLVGKVELSEDGPGFLSRLQLVIKGAAKEFEKRAKRITNLTSLLQIYLSEFTIQLQQKTQLEKILRPSSTEFIPRYLEGTSNWVWSHETFLRWLQTGDKVDSHVSVLAPPDVSNRVLVLYGVKGCGKSVLSVSVVERLREQGSTTLFFSFWAGDEQQRRSDNMLRTLLWQLLDGLPKDQQIHHIARLLQNQAKLKQVDLLAAELHTLITEQKRVVYCVLDGVDESVDDWNDLQGGPLASLVKMLQPSTQIKFMLVGRQPSLRSALRRWPLQIEVTKGLVHDDLVKLISSELENCPNITDESVRESVRSQLEADANAMFLWITLIFKELRVSFSSLEVRSTLERLPEGLDREYYRLFTMLMRRLNGRSNYPSVGMTRSRYLFSIIIGALRPLTIKELQFVYAVVTLPADSDSWAENLVSEEGIMDACGDFITVRDDLVYLGHTSIREFLLRPAGQWMSQDASIEYFRLDQQQCQSMIGLACFRYLKQVNWQAINAGESVEPLARRYPLLQYASCYMASHLLNSDMRKEEILSDLGEFWCSGDFPAWMDFLVSSETDDNNHATCPAFIWDDMIHLWAILKEMSHYTPRSISFWQHNEHANSGRGEFGAADESRGFLNWICNNVFEDSMDSQIDAPGNPGTLNDNKVTVAIDVSGLQTLLGAAESQHTSIGFRQLALIVPLAKTCVQKFGTLSHPLDFLFQSIEQTLKGMSFVSCMAVAKSIENVRPKLAIKAGRIALQKVNGTGDLREVLVLSFIGNLLLFHEETLDADSAEWHLRKSRDIMAKMPRNPLLDVFWCEVARVYVLSLLELERIDEAQQAAKELESRLLETAPPKSNGGHLREWCYKRLRDSTMLGRMKMRTVVLLGNHYDNHYLFEDAERLLSPFVRDYSSIGHHYRNFYDAFAVLATATSELGKTDDAIRIWTKAKEICNDKNKTDRRNLNHAKCNRAQLLWSDDRLEEAQEEFSSVDLRAYFQNASEEQAIDALKAFFNTYVVLGKKETAMQALNEHLPIIKSDFFGQLKDSLWFIPQTLLSSGEYEESASYIRQWLNCFRAEEPSDIKFEFFLCERLAISLRLQSYKPKQPDPICQYINCLRLGRLSQMPEWYLKRVQIGLGTAYEAANEREQAAATFDEVALFCFENSCGTSMCIMKLLERLFHARARLQENKFVDAIFELSRMVVELAGFSECFCEHTDGDDSLLYIIGHLHLADIMDACGNPGQAINYFKEALAMLLGAFCDGSTVSEVPRKRRTGDWQRRWLNSCLAFLDKRINDTLNAGIKWEPYPLELLWPVTFAHSNQP